MTRKHAWILVLCVSVGLVLFSRISSARKSDAGMGEKSRSTQKTDGASSNESANEGLLDANSGAQGSDTVRIVHADQERAGIKVATVEMRAVPRVLTVAGQVQMDEQHTSQVGVIADGRITSVNVLPGAVVQRGTILGSLHSHMVHETVGALAQAFAAVDRQRGAVTFAQQERNRYSHLYSIQAASLEESQRAEQDLLQARSQLLDAEANVRMEREHLSELLQVAPESLTPSTLYDKEIVPIRSAIDGDVIARNVTVGQVVSAGLPAFVVSNLSTVWITASVNERDLSLIHVGASASLSTQGYPNYLFHGQVAMVGDTLDPQTRTIPVRIEVPNPGTRLRPGMFASVQIAEPQTTNALFVPEEAIQDINGHTVVFVTADGTSFHAQAVTAGIHSEGKAEIVDGLQPKDQIVVGGAFMVKSEMLKSTMSGD